MGLEIQTPAIGSILANVLKSIDLFQDYELNKQETQKINHPTKIINYDFTFVSEKYDRWIFVRVQDFYSHQNLVIWINQLTTKMKINLDVRSYFISELGDNSIKQKLIFKAKTEGDLEIALNKIFKYMANHFDDPLRKVLCGEFWIEMPFDWGDYK